MHEEGLRHLRRRARIARAGWWRRRCADAAASVLLILIGVAPAAGTGGPAGASTTATSIRFLGSGTGEADRVTIRVAEPSTRADLSWSFTVEWWMRAWRSANSTGEPSCGPGVYGWIAGHVIVDRDRWPTAGTDGRDFGVSVGRSGRLAFGLANEDGQARTVCTTGVDVLDGRWHHVAVQRRNRSLEIWVDGVRRASAEGPAGSVRYPTSGFTPRRWDPYLVLGAEKHDAGPAFPSYAGRMDELRVSIGTRYTATFTPARRPHRVDDRTVLLFHFDAAREGPCTTSVRDAAGVRNGVCRFGGRGGPRFVADSPFG